MEKSMSLAFGRGDAMKSTVLKVIKFFIIISVLILTVACAKKPSGCADTETRETIKNLFIKNFRLKIYHPSYTEDPKQLLDNYIKSIKIELTSIISNGYDENAKKYSCRADFSVKTVSGEEYSRKINYSSQLTQDKQELSYIEIQAFTPFIEAVALDFIFYFEKNK
jgi:hypothetical protein